MNPGSLWTVMQIVGALALLGLFGLFTMFLLGCASMSKYDQDYQADRREARDGMAIGFVAGVPASPAGVPSGTSLDRTPDPLQRDRHIR